MTKKQRIFGIIFNAVFAVSVVFIARVISHVPPPHLTPYALTITAIIIFPIAIGCAIIRARTRHFAGRPTLLGILNNWVRLPIVFFFAICFFLYYLWWLWLALAYETSMSIYDIVPLGTVALYFGVGGWMLVGKEWFLRAGLTTAVIAMLPLVFQWTFTDSDMPGYVIMTLPMLGISLITTFVGLIYNAVRIYRKSHVAHNSCKDTMIQITLNIRTLLSVWAWASVSAVWCIFIGIYALHFARELEISMGSINLFGAAKIAFVPPIILGVLMIAAKRLLKHRSIDSKN